MRSNIAGGVYYTPINFVNSSLKGPCGETRMLSLLSLSLSFLLVADRVCFWRGLWEAYFLRRGRVLPATTHKKQMRFELWDPTGVKVRETCCPMMGSISRESFFEGPSRGVFGQKTGSRKYLSCLWWCLFTDLSAGSGTPLG